MTTPYPLVEADMSSMRIRNPSAKALVGISVATIMNANTKTILRRNRMSDSLACSRKRRSNYVCRRWSGSVVSPFHITSQQYTCRGWVAAVITCEALKSLQSKELFDRPFARRIWRSERSKFVLLGADFTLLARWGRSEKEE